MPARLPKVPVVPGDYAVEWFVDDRSLAGELSLEPNRPPLAELFGHVVPPNSSSNVRGFPEEYHFDRFTGRLRSNLDVVLTDAHISTWFPQRSHLSARHAIVGMNVSEVLGDAFCHARFQLTSLDLLFGVAPVQSVTWPPEGAPHLSGRYAIDTNPHADQE